MLGETAVVGSFAAALLAAGVPVHAPPSPPPAASCPAELLTFLGEDGVPVARLTVHPQPGAPREVLEFARSPGLDGAWGTEDDPITDRTVAAFAGSRPTWEVHDALAGPDDRWGTEDDVPDALFTFETDGAGLVRREVVRLPPPPAGSFRPEDRIGGDVVGWYDYRRDAAGRLLEIVFHGGRGGDSTWMTADDSVMSRTVFRYRPGNRIDVALGYDAPGPDGVFGTSDDLLGARAVFVYDAAGRWTGARHERAREGQLVPWGAVTVSPPLDRATGCLRRALVARLLVLAGPLAGPLWTPIAVSRAGGVQIPR